MHAGSDLPSLLDRGLGAESEGLAQACAAWGCNPELGSRWNLLCDSLWLGFPSSPFPLWPQKISELPSPCPLSLQGECLDPTRLLLLDRVEKQQKLIPCCW